MIDKLHHNTITRWAGGEDDGEQDRARRRPRRLRRRPGGCEPPQGIGAVSLISVGTAPIPYGEIHRNVQHFRGGLGS